MISVKDLHWREHYRVWTRHHSTDCRLKDAAQTSAAMNLASTCVTATTITFTVECIMSPNSPTEVDEPVAHWTQRRLQRPQYDIHRNMEGNVFGDPVADQEHTRHMPLLGRMCYPAIFLSKVYGSVSHFAQAIRQHEGKQGTEALVKEDNGRARSHNY